MLHLVFFSSLSVYYNRAIPRARLPTSLTTNLNPSRLWSQGLLNPPPPGSRLRFLIAREFSPPPPHLSSSDERKHVPESSSSKPRPHDAAINCGLLFCCSGCPRSRPRQKCCEGIVTLGRISTVSEAIGRVREGFCRMEDPLGLRKLSLILGKARMRNTFGFVCLRNTIYHLC